MHNEDDFVVAYPPEVLALLMAEFIETTRFLGTVQPWRATLETYNDPDDDVAVKWDPSQPRDEQGQWTSTSTIPDATAAGDEPSPDWAKPMPPTSPPKKGQSLVVFRIGRGEGLAGRNAANAEGIAAHLANQHEYGAAPMGDVITAYRVTLTADMQEGYVPVREGEAPAPAVLPTDAVGRGGYFFGRGYTFPTSGQGYTATPIASIPVSELDLLPGRDTADQLREKFSQRLGQKSKPVAITENLAAHKGMEMVSVKELEQFRTQDRRVENKSTYNITEPTETLLPRLTQELREGQPIREPLTLSYDTEAGLALLMDGNTRLAAIADAGYTHAPVVISRSALHGFGKAVKKLTLEEAGITPYRNWLKPSEVGFSTLAKKWDEDQPRAPKGTPQGGKWVKEVGGGSSESGDRGAPRTSRVGKSFTSEEGYDWHEKGPGIGWAKSLRYADIKQLSNYSGFGYHDVNDLRRGTYKQPVKNYFVRAATPEEMARVGWDVVNNKWVPSIKVKEGEYKPGFPVDPRDQMTPEREAQFGHPMGKSNPSDFNPADPYHQVADGRIVVNQYYRPDDGGPPMMFSIQRAAPDAERLAQVQGEADALDDLIAHRGLVLSEDTTVLRGAYLPGVTVEDLQDMELYGKVYEEKGFTSTFLGDAEGRARSYPALGKWESIHQRYKSKGNPLIEHQDEVGTAIQFHITLPAGTKVASIEAARRMSHTFPPKPDGSGRDYAAEPTMGTEDLQDKKTRSESEILLGSGARFKVTRVAFGYTYETGDPLLKPVKVYEVHLEYIGGGSSEGTR